MKSKDICSILSWPLLLWIGQFFIVAIISTFYYIITKDVNNFETFLNHHAYIVMILEFLFFFPILKKKKFLHKKIHYKEAIKIVLLGFLISIPLNIIILILKINIYKNIDYSIYPFVALNIVFIGPILEELIFRGIVFEKLKKKFSTKSSKWISTILFSVSHGNIFSIVNAFIEGYILVSLYEKYKNIYISILYHITINLIGTIFIPVLYQVVFC